jgi:hypothetical protein
MKNRLPTLFLLLLFIACSKEESQIKNDIKYKFEQSVIYLDKNCTSPKDLSFQIIAQGNIDSTFSFEVFLDEYILDTIILLSPSEKGKKFIINKTNRQTFNIAIPTFDKYNRQAMALKIIPLNPRLLEFSYNIPIEYVKEGDIIEFIESPNNSAALLNLNRGTWPNYEGDLIPKGHEYIVHSKTTKTDYKNKNGSFRKLKYEVTLVDQESRQEIKITPALEITREVPEIYQLTEGITIKETPTNTISVIYSTKDFDESVFPGYQMQSILAYHLVKAKLKECHELEIIDRIKLLKPNAFEFFSFTPSEIEAIKNEQLFQKK